LIVFLDDEALSVSVTPLNTVLVTCDVSHRLKEFSADGVLLRQITLSAELINPTHAIQLPLPSGQLVISHGKIGDRLHRVCLVAAVDRSRPDLIYGGPEGLAVDGRLSVPSHIAAVGCANAAEQSLYLAVADQNNQRVGVLDSTLKHVRELDLLKGLLQGKQRDPIRLCVADDGRVIVSYIVCNGDFSTSGEVVFFHLNP